MTPFPDGSGVAGGPSPLDTYSAQMGGVAPASEPTLLAPGPEAPVGATDAPLGPPTGLWAEDWRSAPAVAPDGADDRSGGYSLGTPGRFNVEAALAQAVPTGLDLSAALTAPPEQPDAVLALAGGDPKTKLCPTCGASVPFRTMTCPDCGYDWKGHEKVGLNASADQAHLAILYGVGVPLNLAAEADDGLIWKVACKTGVLALSPGPGQTDLEKPLELTPDLFDDLITGYQEKAFPYVTIPETHANGSLENTGYVKALEKLTKAELMADPRIPQAGKDHVAGDADDIEYLLAGLGFTDPTAKEKALNGSIPDTSIGVKFGYRNKRTGNTYNALEHIALTPIPWVDGNIPFNPAMVLGVTPFDQEYEESQERVPFDGVYTEPTAGSLALATEIRTTGDAFNPAATRAALMALTPGDSLSWNWDVNVERLSAPGGDGDGAYYLVRAPQSVDPADYDWERKPALYTDLESAMGAVSQGVATCLQRRANEKARNQAMADTAAPVPGYAKYGAESGTDLDLAVFDESKHPRLHGRFTKGLGHLDFKPATVATRTTAGHPEGTKIADVGGGVKVVKHPDGAHTVWRPTGKHGGSTQAAMTGPDGQFKSNGAPSSKADAKALEAIAGKAPTDVLTPGDKPDPDAATIAAMKPSERISLPDNIEIVRTREGGWHVRQHGTAVDGVRSDAPNAGADVAKLVSGLRKARKPTKLSATGVEDEDTLSLSGGGGSLGNANHEGTGMTPTTVEELLAQQQAEIERLNALVSDQGVALSASTDTIQGLSTVTHRDSVLKRITAIAKHYPPSVVLAAREVMLADRPGGDPSKGMNLSVQAPKADGTGVEPRELKSPTEIVAFMLSAMPTKDGETAHQLAQLHDNVLDGLDAFNLSAHDGANGSLESREAEAKAVVTEWEKTHHPERFGEDGKRIAA